MRVNKLIIVSLVKLCLIVKVIMSSMLIVMLMGVLLYKGIFECFIFWVFVLVVSIFFRNESIEIFAFVVLFIVIFVVYY